MSGAKRLINFDGKLVKIAGSADGTTVLVMNDKSTSFNTVKLKRVGFAIEQLLANEGATLLELKASAANKDLVAPLFVYDKDVYSTLKTYTVE